MQGSPAAEGSSTNHSNVRFVLQGFKVPLFQDNATENNRRLEFSGCSSAATAHFSLTFEL
jgi:hypothetical protein